MAGIANRGYIEGLETQQTLLDGTWVQDTYGNYAFDTEALEAAVQLINGTLLPVPVPGGVAYICTPEALETPVQLLEGTWVTYGYITYTMTAEALELSTIKLLEGTWT